MTGNGNAGIPILAGTDILFSIESPDLDTKWGFSAHMDFMSVDELEHYVRESIDFLIERLREYMMEQQ